MRAGVLVRGSGLFYWLAIPLAGLPLLSYSPNSAKSLGWTSIKARCSPAGFVSVMPTAPFSWSNICALIRFAPLRIVNTVGVPELSTASLARMPPAPSRKSKDGSLGLPLGRQPVLGERHLL